MAGYSDHPTFTFTPTTGQSYAKTYLRPLAPAQLLPLAQALERGESLIIFPEGTRRAQALPSPFKSGLFHLATRFPAAELVPVYLDNLYRSMPKGSLLPVPLTCSVRFGAPLERRADEAKDVFLERARQAIVELA